MDILGKNFSLNLSREQINTLHVMLIGPALIYLGSQVVSGVTISKETGTAIYVTGIIVMLYHFLRLNELNKKKQKK